MMNRRVVLIITESTGYRVINLIHINCVNIKDEIPDGFFQNRMLDSLIFRTYVTSIVLYV